ncbi:hypothetical protein [Endozoicomonas sp. GU-1]|uniref:hypothetical protein n=1 Tax=Endozoicomonas sp. GU-1 TaxID=3009078 RepID=UPI0022B35AB9|nr:hypothetical protein [Endozoicomonas sp. GU-1]WBA79383.1 hypothetical protein O2T12_13405 [Endozoicomonas sp. GU-1]WBA87027.1 hypothetical protein O3276_02985 [Endozoicomonas sp. GU-1]
MDRSSAGISGQYARSDNGYNQPNGRAPSLGRGRYRHATVRQWNHPPALHWFAINFTILLVHALLNIYNAVQSTLLKILMPSSNHQ